MNGYNNIQNELRRIIHGPQLQETPSGCGIVRFMVKCASGPENVLNRVRTLLCSVDQISLKGSLSDEQWTAHLPEWFVSVSPKPMTEEEAASWLAWWGSLSREEQIKDEVNKAWSIDNWLYWMTSENRQWYWWDAKIATDGIHILVDVQVECWPFPWGAFRWLFKAAGAMDVSDELEDTQKGTDSIFPSRSPS